MGDFYSYNINYSFEIFNRTHMIFVYAIMG